MPTFSSALLPTTNGLTFGSAALRWTAYLQDVDIAGVPTFTGRIGIKNLEDIRFADQYTGTVTQQLDGALADVVTGLVVAPSTMGAGSPTSINSAQYLLDLRNGVFKIFCSNTTTPMAQVSGSGLTSPAFSGAVANQAAAGLYRAAKSETFNFRNNANGADINGLSLDSSDIVQVGGSAGAKTVGPMAFSGALTGITNLSYSGQIISSVATGTAPLSVTSTTVVPNLNVSTLNGVVVSGAPTSGQSLVATGVATAGWTSNSTTYKLENIQYTPTTFISSAGGTLFTYSLPANELAVGQALRIKASGYYQNTSGVARTYTFTLKAGATTLASTAFAASAGSVTNSVEWGFEFLVICTAAGSSGTVESQIQHGMTAQSAVITSVTQTANTATIAFDTTSIQSLTLNVTQTNDATTATTGRQWMVERLG